MKPVWPGHAPRRNSKPKAMLHTTKCARPSFCWRMIEHWVLLTATMRPSAISDAALTRIGRNTFSCRPRMGRTPIGMADNILLCCPNNYALRGWRVACHACVEKYLMQHSQHGQVLLEYDDSVAGRGDAVGDARFQLKSFDRRRTSGLQAGRDFTVGYSAGAVLDKEHRFGRGAGHFHGLYSQPGGRQLLPDACGRSRRFHKRGYALRCSRDRGATCVGHTH